MKFYNNMPLEATVDESNPKHLTTVGAVRDKLWEKKTREVVDSEAYYSLETDSTLAGVKQVVTNITDADTQILLDEINTQLEPVDLTSLVGDGTEYVLYHDRVVHTEEYEETIYLPRSETPEGNILMTTDEFNDLWGTVEVLDYKQS